MDTFVIKHIVCANSLFCYSGISLSLFSIIGNVWILDESQVTDQDEGHYRVIIEAWNSAIGTQFISEVSIELKLKISFSSCLTNMPAPNPVLFPDLYDPALTQEYLHLRTGEDVEHSLPEFTFQFQHSCAYRLMIEETDYTWISLTAWNQPNSIKVTEYKVYHYMQ